MQSLTATTPAAWRPDRGGFLQVGTSTLNGRLRFLFYLVALVLPLACWNGAFPLDDAYIVLHNARVLLGGGVDALYRTSALTGSTSPVHLLLVAGMGLVLPLPLASLAVAAASAIAYALGLDRLTFKMGATGWPRCLLVLAGLVGGVLPLQIFNGLETGLAAAVVTWLLVLADDRRVIGLVGVAPFVRPELALLGLFIMVRRGRSIGWVHLLPELIVAGLIAVPFVTWQWVETGHLIAQTATAKAAFFARAEWSAGLRMQFLLSAWVQSGFLPLALGLLVSSEGGWMRSGFVVLVSVAAIATIPDALTWNHCRYLVPMVPALIANLSILSQERMGRVIVAALSALCLASLPGSLSTLRAEQAYWQRETDALQATLAQLPPNATVLIHDAGLIAWLNPPLHLVDVVGLKSPVSIAWHRRSTRRTCEMGAALDGIARETGASYALVLPQLPWSCVATNLHDAGWHLTPLPGPSHYRLFALGQP